MKSDNIVICLQDGGDASLAQAASEKLNIPIADEPGQDLTLLFDASGAALCGYGMRYQGDFSQMVARVTKGRLLHEMLVKAAKTTAEAPKAIDATAGMGEDSFLLAAYGYEVTLFEQNPVVAILLKDALRRAEQDESTRAIAQRMHVVEGDSIRGMQALAEQEASVDFIYLDPMFPKRQKSGLIGKKMQLIQHLETPCAEESELFQAALLLGNVKKEGMTRIAVKRPLKAPQLAGRKPNYVLEGKAIRYDCYTL